jgi:glutathione S-transferase
MYTLFSRPGSGGFVVEATLALAGAPFTLINVARGEAAAEFRRLSPLGKVPALILPDGRSLTESAAISIWLAEQYPQAALAPPAGSPGRADFLRWISFLSSELYPALLRWFYAPRYTTDAAGVEAVKAAALAEIERDFAVVEEALAGRDWLAGEGFSIADVYLLMLAHWHPVGDRPREEWTGIVGLCARLREHPVLAKLNEAHRLW